MPTLVANDILAALDGAVIAGAPPEHFSGVSTDSRTVNRGDLFVALRGERYDGHAFAAEALRKGAAAALVAHPVEDARGCLIQVPDTLKALGQLAAAHRARFDLPVIAVTGSAGKTTTKEMAAAILARCGRVLKTHENFNNEIGVPIALLGLDEDTGFAVIELAMRGAGQIAYLAGIAKPTIGVVTNIGPSHLELLGSLEAVAAAKAELLETLPPTGAAVVNADAPHADLLRARAAAPVVTFAIEQPADVRAEDITQDDRAAARFRLVAPGGEADVALGVPGRRNVHNALAAAAAALAAGATLRQVADGLAAVAPAHHRLELIEAPAGFRILDDCYNASPESVAMALEVLESLPANRRFAVLGDMRELGPQAEQFHREIGEQAARSGLERLIAVGELGRWIAQGAQPVLDRDRVEWAESNALAIVVGCLLAALPAPALIALLRKRGLAQEIRDDGPQRHHEKAGTPTMGGLLIVGSLSLAFLLLAGWLRLQWIWPGLLLVALTLVFAAIGLADDCLMIKHGRSLGLKARHKLLLQFVVAAGFLWAVHAWGGLTQALTLPFSARAVTLGWAYFPFAALLIVGMSNAVNLTDGLDGLAAGLVLICCAALGVVAGWLGDEATRLFCFCVVGACAGFLWFNVHPARIFMGDTGALALGAAIAGVGVMLSEELGVLIIGIVFVAEAFSVIAQVIAFKTTRRRIIRMSPLHHHFELGGWPENQVVVRFWIIAALVAVAVLAARPML